jgi:hypothetical protein
VEVAAGGTRQAPQDRGGTDTAPAGDATARVTSQGRGTAEGLVLGEEAARALLAGREATEHLLLDDWPARALGYAATTGDLLAVPDDVAVTTAGAVAAAADWLAGQDAAVRGVLLLVRLAADATLLSEVTGGQARGRNYGQPLVWLSGAWERAALLVWDGAAGRYVARPAYWWDPLPGIWRPA